MRSAVLDGRALIARLAIAAVLIAPACNSDQAQAVDGPRSIDSAAPGDLALSVDQSIAPDLAAPDLARAPDLAAHCLDGVRDADETDVDCGGRDCVACPGPCGACHVSADCASNVCFRCVCYPAACGDHVPDGNETDVDCGGGACPPCAAGKTCRVNADCLSGSCVAGRCV
jgi:hypothetical protein